VTQLGIELMISTVGAEVLAKIRHSNEISSINTFLLILYLLLMINATRYCYTSSNYDEKDDTPREAGRNIFLGVKYSACVIMNSF